MKKLLLSSAAVCGLAMAATPAMAQVELEVGGHFKGYAGILNQDKASVYTASEERAVDIFHDIELEFGGETTLDNGLTVGVQIEMDADATNSDIEESYAYFSGGWGRINLGAEDGAAYLLQVAAPSADSNIDGLRNYVQPVDYTIAFATGAATVNGFANQLTDEILEADYDQDPTGKLAGITYLTPVLGGFQVGLTYKPDAGEGVRDTTGTAGAAQDDVDEAYGEAYEAALRYEGEFEGVGVIAGAGYTHVALEKDADGATTDTTIFGTAVDLDDRELWNVGLDLDFGPIGLGVIYAEDDFGVTDGGDQETLVVGADYTTGPFKLGASWLNRDNEIGVGAGEMETDRYTGGVVYTYGPGMTFRGSISYIEHDLPSASTFNDIEATSVLLGTQINF